MVWMEGWQAQSPGLYTMYSGYSRHWQPGTYVSLMLHSLQWQPFSGKKIARFPSTDECWGFASSFCKLLDQHVKICGDYPAKFWGEIGLAARLLGQQLDYSCHRQQQLDLQLSMSPSSGRSVVGRLEQISPLNTILSQLAQFCNIVLYISLSQTGDDISHIKTQ